MISTRKKGEAVAEPIVYGEELLSAVVAEPTIDIYLDRSPKLNTPKDYEEMVLILRRKRAAFITAEQKKREPKIEGAEDVEIENTNI